MKNFRVLYRFELKKLCRKKSVIITFAIMLLVMAFTVCGDLLGNYYVDGEVADTHYNMLRTDSAYARALNGRAIDQQLLEETQEAYGKMPEGVERYTLTEEYQLWARPYSEIHGFMAQNLKIPYALVNTWKADETQLYADRAAQLEENWADNSLTEGEKNFWRQKELELKKPFVYRYSGSFAQLADCVYTFGFMILLMVAISLSGVFTEEHSRRMDQLLLSSKLGKRKLYWAKILAGFTFAAGSTLLFSAAAVLLSFLLYGTGGSQAAIQLVFTKSSLQLNMGEMVLILYGVMLVSAILAGVFIMVLSELLRSNIGTLSIVTGILLLTMFVQVPSQYRVSSQLWSYIPSNFISPWNTFGAKLVPVAGTYLPPWQAVPVCYLLLAGLLALAGRRIYERYQVGGR